MFSLLTGFYDSYLAPTQLNVLVVGAPSAGKTALLERLKATQFPKRPGKLLQEPPTPLGPALHEAFAEGGALAPSAHSAKPEPDTCSETTTETNNTPKPIAPPVATTASVKPKPKTVSKSKPPPTKSRFKLSICPAPQRYTNAAADEDEEFVVDEQDDAATHGAAENDDTNPSYKAAALAGDFPATPEVSRRVRGRSKEFSTQDLDLINSVEHRRMAGSMDSIPLDDVPSFPSLQPAAGEQQQQQAASTVPSLSLLQQEAKEYDLNPKKKMLALSKIRPTSKFLLSIYAF